MKSIRDNKIFIGLFVIALITRLGILLLYPWMSPLQHLVESGDAMGYIQLAQHLFTNGVFKFDMGGPTAYRMPGYPLVLVVTYAIWRSPLPAQLLQIFLDLLTCFLTYQIGRHILKSVKFALFATAIVAFNPLLIISSIAILPETITIFLVTLATLLLIKWRGSIQTSLLVAGILGISIYMKPTLAPVTVVILVILGADRWRCGLTPKAFVMSGLPFIIVGVLLTPWIWRNLLVMQAFIPLTTSDGSNFYGGNNPQADGGYVSSEPYVLPHVSEVESNVIFRQRAIDWIWANPGDFIKLLPYKAIRFVWPLAFGTSGYVVVPTIVFYSILVIFIIFYGFVFYGIWRLIVTKCYWLAVIIGTPYIMLLLLSLWAFGASRFALPVFPALALFASTGAQAMEQRIQCQRVI